MCVGTFVLWIVHARTYVAYFAILQFHASARPTPDLLSYRKGYRESVYITAELSISVWSCWRRPMSLSARSSCTLMTLMSDITLPTFPSSPHFTSAITISVGKGYGSFVFTAEYLDRAAGGGGPISLPEPSFFKLLT